MRDQADRRRSDSSITTAAQRSKPRLGMVPCERSDDLDGERTDTLDRRFQDIAPCHGVHA